jgi:hypothetical protein
MRSVLCLPVTSTFPPGRRSLWPLRLPARRASLQLGEAGGRIPTSAFQSLSHVLSFRIPHSEFRIQLLCPMLNVFCPLSSVIRPLSSVFCPLSSVICHPSSVIRHCPPSSALRLTSSVLCLPSSVLCLLSSVFSHLSSDIYTSQTSSQVPAPG